MRGNFVHTNIFPAAFLSVAGGSVADLFANDKVARCVDRQVVSLQPINTLFSPMALYTISPFIGPVLGPAFSGFINQHTSWRWTFYTMIIWATVQLVELYLVSTYCIIGYCALLNMHTVCP
jgi:MFS family permease